MSNQDENAEKIKSREKIKKIGVSNLSIFAILFGILSFLPQETIRAFMGLSYFGLFTTPEGNTNAVSAIMFIVMLACLVIGETYLGLLQTKLGHRLGYLRFGLALALIGVMFPFDRFPQTHAIAANAVYGLLLAIMIGEVAGFKQPGKILIAPLVSTSIMITIFALYLALLHNPELAWIDANAGVLQKIFVVLFFAGECYRHYYGDNEIEPHIAQIVGEKWTNFKIHFKEWVEKIKMKYQMGVAESEDPAFVKRLLSVEKAVQEQTDMMKKLLTLIDGLMGLQIDQQIDAVKAEIATIQQNLASNKDEIAASLAEYENKEHKLEEIVALLIAKFKPAAEANYKSPFPMGGVKSK
jgi:hypothetical protein